MVPVKALERTGSDVEFEKELELGPSSFRTLYASSFGEHVNIINSPLVSRDRKTMAPKTYKEMKEAWVTGHTGGSVADVNIVSFAMPVPYTSIRPRMGLN